MDKSRSASEKPSQLLNLTEPISHLMSRTPRRLPCTQAVMSLHTIWQQPHRPDPPDAAEYEPQSLTTYGVGLLTYQLWSPMSEVPCRTSTTRLLYSRKEAAYQLSISTRSLDYLIATREIAVRRNGKRILIPHGELVRYARADHYQPIRPQSAQPEAQAVAA
jgi:hypothetical protein